MTIVQKSISETVPLERDAIAGLREAQSRMSLVFFHRNGSELVTLSEGESMVVGRSSPSDLVIRDASLSRQHARFRLQNGKIQINDLQSTNGIQVNGEWCENAALNSSDEVMMGAISVFMHAPTQLGARALRLDSHDHFLLSLEEELKRAKHFRRPLTLLQIAGASGKELHIRQFASVVLGQLRDVDRAGLYSSGILELLLPEMDEKKAGEFAKQLIDRCHSDGLFLVASVGVFPVHETSAQSLLELVRNGLMKPTKEEPVHTASSLGDKTWGVEKNRLASMVVFASYAMEELMDTITKVARSSMPILLNGETGVGKEVVAQHIHQQSDRSKKPIICINCAAIPPTLLESILFGHEKGAFTGATARKKGVFEAADGGTVLLDEIGELTPEAQAALLRVLENAVVSRVGSTKELPVDIRIITATHRNLEQMCGSGKFRQDLFFRLNMMPLVIPPLRSRPEDITVLSRHFLALANEKNGMDIQSISSVVMACFQRYSWPGNVRELKNVMERAVVICTESQIELEDLPSHVQGVEITNELREEDDESSQRPRSPGTRTAVEPAPLLMKDVEFRTQVKMFEAKLILEALNEVDGIQTQAAKVLQMPLRTLVHKMKTLGIRKQSGSYLLPEDRASSQKPRD